MKKSLAIIFMLGCLSGCTTWDNMGKTEKGAIIGAGSGALIGTAVTGDAKGALLAFNSLGNHVTWRAAVASTAHIC